MKLKIGAVIQLQKNLLSVANLLNITQLYCSNECQDIVTVKSTVRNEDIDKLTNSITNLSSY